jgi:transposase
LRGRSGKSSVPANSQIPRARRGLLIAVAASARKLTVLCWHLVIKDHDNAFARPSPTNKKIRALERRAGMPAHRGKKSAATTHNLTHVRREHEVSVSWTPRASWPPVGRKDGQ